MGESKLGSYLFDELLHCLARTWKDQFSVPHDARRIESLQLLLGEQPEVSFRLLESVCRGRLNKNEKPSIERACMYHAYAPHRSTCACTTLNIVESMFDQRKSVSSVSTEGDVLEGC